MDIEINSEKNREINMTQIKEIEKGQNNFLNSTIGKVINSAINMGLKFVLPDFIENQVIEVKDALIKGGLKEGIDTAVKSAINMGKAMLGIVTGRFDNVNQIELAIEKGGIISSTSSLIDNIVNKTVKKGSLNPEIGNMIKKGKNVILDNISVNIEDMLTKQIRNIEGLNENCMKWQKEFDIQNFDGMEKAYNKIKDQMKEIIPFENTIKLAREIESKHEMIKNNNKNFDLSFNQLQAAKILI